MNIFDVIKKWGLDDPKLNFNNFGRKAVGKMTNDIQNCYLRPLPPSTGRFSQSLTTATEIVENRKRVEELALPLLFSKQLVLPDPLYSLLAPRAAMTWKKLPESGNKSFSKTPLITSSWKNYWATDFSECFAYLNLTLPPLIAQLIKLRPLIEAGYIVLQPWELAVESEMEALKTSVLELQKKPEVIKEITQRYRQGDYNIGIRLGSISIDVSTDQPLSGLKKGDSLWFGDKTEVLVMGLIHCIVAKKYSSNLWDTLPGDRIVFDYLRTNGNLRPKPDPIINSIQIPDLSRAMWDDIVAIKKDSELLSQFKDAITEISYCSEDHQKNLIREEMACIESKIKADTSLSKYAKSSLLEFSVAGAATLASNYITGSTPKTAAIAAASAASITLGYKFVSEYFSAENQSLKKRRDIVIRIKKKL